MRSDDHDPDGLGPGEPGPAALRSAADQVWELWNLRALWPDAGPADLDELHRKRDAILAREREALAGLWSGDRVILAPGHGFFAAHPELAGGVTVSLHLGPYRLLPEPLLERGLEPVVLVNATALAKMRPDVDRMVERLGCRGRLRWVEVGAPGFARRLLAEARAGRPLLVYLDGNSGGQGLAETRERGLDYRLPGRAIRLRTGLARLVCRLELPVHLVTVRWDDDGAVRWDLVASERWTRADDPETVTRLLADWMFAEIRLRPEQWHFWSMLKESSACFARGDLRAPAVPRGLREDFVKAFRLCCERAPQKVRLLLQREVAVWPGEVLADLSEDRFYPAEGLRDTDLEPLRDGRPTLAELAELHGEAWLRRHGLRLCLLGLARLGA